MATSFVILAAGRGTRLGGAVPKPLTLLNDGRTIIQQQLANLTEVFGATALEKTFVVVGHRADELKRALPKDVHIVLNGDYLTTNTSKSLAKALEAVPQNDGVLWLNGDVVFEAEILRRSLPTIDQLHSFAIVNDLSTGEEEVKYRTGKDGAIVEISKAVISAQGEAVGINHVAPADRDELLAALKSVGQQDYFEAAMERTIQNGINWKALSVGDLRAVEVDFPEDLIRANEVRIEP